MWLGSVTGLSMILLQRRDKGDAGRTQSLLTRGKHADRHREQVGTQICTSSSRPRRYGARPPRSEGRAGLGEVGGTPACLLLLSGCFYPPHKLFTSGYTKGNSGALIVAEGKFMTCSCSLTTQTCCSDSVSGIRIQ